MAGWSQDCWYRAHCLTPATLETRAADLRVSVPRLRDACLKVAAAPPSKLIQDRILLEARRALLYSNMTIAETGHDRRTSAATNGASGRADRLQPGVSGARLLQPFLQAPHGPVPWRLVSRARSQRERGAS